MHHNKLSYISGVIVYRDAFCTVLVMQRQLCCDYQLIKVIAVEKETRVNISLRLPDSVINRADAKAKELNLKRTDIVEKALRCFLGMNFDQQCENLSEVESLKNLLNNVIQANNLKTTLD